MSLRTQLPLSLVGVLTLVFGATGALSVHMLREARDTLNRSVEREARSLVAATSEALAITFPSRDYAAVREYVDDLIASRPDILKAAVYDADGEFAVGCAQCDASARDAASAALPATARDTTIKHGDDAIVVTSPLTFRVGETVETYGFIRIRFYSGYVARQFRVWIVQLLTLFLVIAVATLIGSYYLLSRRLVDPILALSDATKKIALGDLSARPPISADGELGALARSFSEMAESLQRTTVSRDELAAEVELRRAVASELLRSETRYRELFRSMSSGVTVFEPVADGRFVVSEINGAMERIHRVTRDDVVGRDVREAFPGVVAMGMMSALKRVAASGTPERHAPALYQTDHATNWCECFIYRLPSGEVIAVCDDVTERMAAEREIERAHQRLIDASRQAGMAEVASGVLHNVGNVLNSMKVSAICIKDRLADSQFLGLAKVVVAFRDLRRRDVAPDVQENRAAQLVDYLEQLHAALQDERDALTAEASSIAESVGHIESIVSTQQEYACRSGVVERVAVSELLESALLLNKEALIRHRVDVERQYDDVGEILVEKHSVLQILMNLIRNAKYAMDEKPIGQRRLTVRVGLVDGDNVRIDVADTGVGISQANLTRIFAHGFTTRSGGHGFGLHSSALAARSIGGALAVHSEGLGCGAVFTLTIPRSNVAVEAR